MTSKREQYKVMGARIADIENRILSKSDRLAEAKKGIVFVPTTYPKTAPSKPVSRFTMALGAGIAAAAAVIVAFAFSTRELSVQANGQSLVEGDWISSRDDGSTELHFSDGSRFQLKSKTGVRVRQLYSDGAYLMLERGTIVADVTHGPDSDWRIDVGPYRIVVTGTRFTVGWDPESESFDLAMLEGTVEITGPMVPRGRTLGAKERLQASLRSGHMAFTSGDQTEDRSVEKSADRSLSDAASVPAAADPAGKDAEADETTPEVATPNRHQDVISWRTLAEKGKYREAVHRARRSGINGILTTGSAPTLISLGDAARHAGEIDLAGRVYKKVRTRFPSSAQASSAAFALGIMAFDKKSAYTEAARWFRIIVRERSGHGSLAQEASGRLIEALHRAGDPAGARAAAQHYLKRYPGGPHAALAKRLTQ